MLQYLESKTFLHNDITEDPFNLRIFNRRQIFCRLEGKGGDEENSRGEG